MVLCLVLGEEVTDRFIFDISVEMWTSMKISHLRDGIKEKASLSVPAHKIKLWKVAIPTKDMNDEKMKILINKSHESINVKEELGGELLDAEDSIIGSSSVPAKRQGEPQDYNRKPVAPSVTDFWNKLSEAQIILKFPKDFNKTAFTPSKYMKIEGDEIVLDSDVMLNAQDELIFNDGKPVLESVESLNFVKFLRFCESPDGIVYGIKTRDILIKKSYLQMIEKLETDRIKEEIKGCTIVGSPGIGKTHYSLYLAFYITRRYSSADFVYQQLNEGKSYTLHINKKNKSVIELPLGLGGEYPANSYYIADSVIPSLCKTIFTFLVTTPKSDRWEQFIKTHPRNYYAPIWTEEEIWSVWNWNDYYKNKIPETRVRELIERWGCIPRRVFVEYNDEPDLDRLLSRCNIHEYLQNDGTGLHDNYSGNIIHIIPNYDFTKKEYAPASNEISKALYNYYAKNTRETIIKIIRDFARTAGGGDFKVRRLTEKNDNLFSEETEALQLRELKINQFHDIRDIASDYYNIPEVENFESVDSIVPIYGNQANYLYQMTIAETYKIKVNGLTKLQNKMDMDLPTHLYFVVPNINDMFDNYYLQDYITVERK
ncbi:2156_t:CDS:2, partial [Funneliformis mosseae]